MREDLFHPKLFSLFKEYNLGQFGRDLLAGLLVAIIALPLSIAFGIASGVTPAIGLMTAIVGGFIVSFFSGSSVQISGPTGAFVVFVYEIIRNFGLTGLLQATFIAGILLVIMGLSKVGSWLKFISRPVVVGFTAGIAASIFISQIKDALGLSMGAVPPQFIDKIVIFWNVIDSTNFYALGITLFTLAVVQIIYHFKKSFPAPFVALLLATLIVYYFQLPIETIYSRFGQLSLTLEYVPLFPLSLERITELFPAAITIALLGGIESLLCALVADGMTGGKHRSNTELIAQGIGNIFTPLLGGIPVTGAISRTAANIRAGGRTPIAGLAHALFLFIIILFLKDLVVFIPMASLAAVLMLIAYNMSEWRSWRHIYQSTKADFFVFLTTFGLTVFLDLIAAIQVGVLLSAFMFVDKMAKAASLKKLEGKFNQVSESREQGRTATDIKTLVIPNDLDVYEFQGALFFGASAKFDQAFQELGPSKNKIAMRFNQITTIDASALHLLRGFAEDLAKEGRELFFTELNTECYAIVIHSTLVEVLPKEHIFKTLDGLLNHIQAAKPQQ
ncbi:MAG: SulP family inorganic anion transporter [Chlamydiia bacterium]